MTLDPATLAALRARPFEPDAFRVLADRLQADGDPRGELITLQLHGFESAVARHLALHARALLGRLFTFQSALELKWEAGFIRRATLRSGEGRQVRRWDGTLLFEHRAKKPFAWLCEELLKLESAALLEELALELPASPKVKALFGGAVEKVAFAAPATLKRLELRRVHPEEDCGELVEREVPLDGRKLLLAAEETSLLDAAHAVLRDAG